MNNKDIQNETPKTSARRRLIRGAFSAPVVMTLYSGSSFAAASNAARCIANQVAFPVDGTNPAITYVKVQLWVLGNSSSSKYSAWVKRSEVVAVKPGATTSTGYTGFEWECVLAGNGSSNTSGYSVGQRLVNPNVPASPGKTLTKTNAPYVAVRFDKDGNIVGVVGAGTTGNSSALAQSCWSSFISA